MKEGLGKQDPCFVSYMNNLLPNIQKKTSDWWPRGAHEFTHMAAFSHEQWILLESVVCLLDLPARSCLSLADLACLSRGTEIQVVVVQGPLAVMPLSAATLCFLCPLILYTPGKFSAVQESAGIRLVICQRQGRFW